MQTKHVGITLGVVAFFGAMLYFTSSPSPALNDAQTSSAAGAVTEQVSETVAPVPPVKAVEKQPNTITTSNKKTMRATMKTNKGTIVIELNTTDAPKTAENFSKLAQAGFYDGIKFHRVIAGFMIQGGDPLTKDDAQQSLWGTGGPGYQFADEIHKNNKNNAGTIAMANAGPNTNGSQFFINVNNNNFLDGKHTVFGTVVEGMDVVKAIETTPTAPGDRPLEAVVIESLSVK
ncbi:MAG: hypothetical protein RI911_115 [Candidatus Parcubacteria bacterium]|jgi:cyclophilin family peptidyl-prolyl cis-trans isomerase